MGGLKGLRTGTWNCLAASGGISWHPAVRQCQLSCSRQALGDNTLLPRRLPADSGEAGMGEGRRKPRALTRFPKLWTFMDVNKIIFWDICKKSRALVTPREEREKSFIHSFIRSLTRSPRPSSGLEDGKRPQGGRGTHAERGRPQKQPGWGAVGSDVLSVVLQVKSGVRTSCCGTHPIAQGGPRGYGC